MSGAVEPVLQGVFVDHAVQDHGLCAPGEGEPAGLGGEGVVGGGPRRDRPDSDRAAAADARDGAQEGKAEKSTHGQLLSVS